jgi:LisH
MSPRPGSLGGPPSQMPGQPQQQQPPLGIGMGRGASSSGLTTPGIPGVPSSNPSLMQNLTGPPFTQEENNEALLNSYIYEHLLKSGFYQAARALLKEAPSLRLSMDPREESSPDQNNEPNPHVQQQRRAAALKRSHSGIDPHMNASPNDKANGKSPASNTNSPRIDHNDLPAANVPLKGHADTGFLRGWWAVFWDIYAARSSMATPSPHANAYLESQVSPLSLFLLTRSVTKVECLRCRANSIRLCRRDSK